MSFSQMLDILRKKHREKIVLINAGAFFIAVGEDAVLLNNKLKLRCTCFKNNICKVGVPINSIDKYLEKIRNLNYSYVIYNFNKQEGSLTLMQEYVGKPNGTKRNNINCLICKGISKYKDDEYLEAIRKLYEQNRK